MLNRTRPILLEVRVFLKNNQIRQTILLVRQRFKLFSFLTIRVQSTRFCHLKMHLEIEYETLDFKLEFLTLEFQVHFQMAKSSPLDLNCQK